MSSPMKRIKFYGSQIGSQTTIPHPYTDSPLTLLWSDIVCALRFYLFLPFIVIPILPQLSGPLSELYPSASNIWSMFLHLILVFMQVPFILSVPFWVFFPVWSVLIGVGVFWAVNQGICYLLNGNKMKLWSEAKFTEEKEVRKNEQWLFLNGVAVGKHWLQSNVNRIALTFGRPVLGVHNKTNGIIFDVLQCLIQRNFTYATQDIRDCYSIIKPYLYDPTLTKIVFILHSQGGIEGGMILDWLLQEVPQDLLAKLEVYTFGNAANHFNNPHLHLLSQKAALTHPTMPATTKTTTSVHYHDSVEQTTAVNTNEVMKSSHQSSASGKTIRYIEHYAHTSDFVARWGVLHYTINFSLTPVSPRFMGRVFERPGEGHQFNMHYLDGMFPLKASATKNDGIGGSGFEGADESEGNEFMNTVLVLGKEGDETKDEREGWEMSYLGAHGEPLSKGETDVLLRDMRPISPSAFGNGNGFTNGVENAGVNGNGNTGVNDNGNVEVKVTGEFRVKDLSRLWLYVNGGSPKMDEVDAGIKTMSTI